MMKKILLLSLAALAIACSKPQKAEQIAIIPMPVKMEIKTDDADFILKSPITISAPQGVFGNIGQYYTDVLHPKFGGSITTVVYSDDDDEPKATIAIKYDDDIAAEGYELEVDSDGIKIKASDYSGAAYALQTLLQLMPEEVFNTKTTNANYAIPAVEIEDYPRFSWRGMHLDCSRHFFSADSVKRYIDYMALNKLNRFHWHLTDDQGWRIESKKYPELNTKAALRIDRSGKAWDDREPINRAAGEEATYGGVYSQDEIRDIVAYAAERGIAVVPEVDIPGHSSAVFAAYPALSCLGKVQEVTQGGYYPEDMATCYCAGNEDAFAFIEGVLTEVIELFPDAPYIHIGGDEVDFRFWKNCPKCQARIKELGLKDTYELQSYFIHRIEKFVNSKGKRIIGWDEILEGGLAPDATVMSWQGVAGGIKAARMGHDVIMTPNSHLYFDYFQNTPEAEPSGCGGMITAKRVYDFDPVLSILTPEEGKHILGLQANMWAEHTPYFTDIERQTLPRMMALAEVAWTPAEARNWDDFSRRLTVNAKRLDAMGANYHKGATAVEFTANLNDVGNFEVSMLGELYGAQIHYTIDGSEPTISSPLYTEPIVINQTTQIKAVVAKDGEVLSKIPSSRTIGVHKAIGKTVTYNHLPSDAYRGANGQQTLVDGLTGSTRHDDGFMQGFNSADFDVVIDMQEITPIKTVAGSFLQSASTWSYLPKELVISISDDNKSWKEIGRATHSINAVDTPVTKHTLEVQAPADTKSRYVRVVGVNPPTAKGLPGAGTVNWIFADEIIIN